MNDIKGEVRDSNLLTISGERNSEVEDEGSNYYERSFGRFSRSFRLLNNADSNNLSASMNRGVLSVRIPKISPDPLVLVKSISKTEKRILVVNK